MVRFESSHSYLSETDSSRYYVKSSTPGGNIHLHVAHNIYILLALNVINLNVYLISTVCMYPALNCIKLTTKKLYIILSAKYDNFISLGRKFWFPILSIKNYPFAEYQTLQIYLKIGSFRRRIRLNG